MCRSKPPVDKIDPQILAEAFREAEEIEARRQSRMTADLIAGLRAWHQRLDQQRKAV